MRVPVTLLRRGGGVSVLLAREGAASPLFGRAGRVLVRLSLAAVLLFLVRLLGLAGGLPVPLD